MSYIVKQKRGNSIYVYEATNYWDKEKNQPRQKRKYLGRINPVSGEFIKSTGIKGILELSIAKILLTYLSQNPQSIITTSPSFLLLYYIMRFMKDR